MFPLKSWTPKECGMTTHQLLNTTVISAYYLSLAYTG